MPAPRFSVVTPVHDTTERALRAMLRSVAEQTFGDWEHCLVDDGSNAPPIRSILDQAAAADRRVRVLACAANGGIVVAGNDALRRARGEFVAVLDHDDELHRDALGAVDEALRSRPDADYVYSDEDTIDQNGRRSAPFYKPDWSPERLRTQMYTGHLSVVRRSLVEQVGGFRDEYQDARDWDLILRVTERARAVVHIPRVLYHWRVPAASTAGNGQAAKPYLTAAGTEVIQAHCDRVGFPASAERSDEHPGVYHLRPRLPDRPLVSIVIPTRGTRRDVRGEQVCLVTQCVRSIVGTSTYPHYEIVVVADTATPPEVVAELRAVAGTRLQVLSYDQPFNFADKINTGVLASRGEHMLMLNDDTQVLTPDWLERLVMYSGFPEVGAVGARLLYGDGRLQHVGVVLHDAVPGHPYRGFAGDHGGYFDVVRVASNYSAVTGACLMTRRSVFAEVGGMSTLFPLSFNDVDYCLKLRSRDLRVVYDPDTVLHHFESASRSPEASDDEFRLLRERWGHATRHDPYDNPNFHPSSHHMVPPVYHADGSVLI